MCIERIDVVIPVKSEAFKLQFCCKYIEKYLPVNNLIIVVSPSKDNTLQYAKEYGNIVIQDENKGVGHARGIGFEKVKTRYFASIDADIIVQKNWYSTCMKIMENPLVAACQGLDRPLGRHYAKWQNSLGEKHTSLGNTMLRTNVVKEVGIPTIPWCEDYTLRHRIESIGYKWITDLNLIVIHLVNDIDILKHTINFGRQQRIEQKKLLKWVLSSFKDFIDPKGSCSKIDGLTLSVYVLLFRLARCYGALRALTRSDKICHDARWW